MGRRRLPVRSKKVGREWRRGKEAVGRKRVDWGQGGWGSYGQMGSWRWRGWQCWHQEAENWWGWLDSKKEKVKLKKKGCGGRPPWAIHSPLPLSESKHDYLGGQRPPGCPLRAESPAGDACSPPPNQTHNVICNRRRKTPRSFKVLLLFLKVTWKTNLRLPKRKTRVGGMN